MTYTLFTPTTRIQEGLDGTNFRIWDESIWTLESDNTTICKVIIYFTNDEGVVIEYDPYFLIVGADKTKFNEYLDIDGHTVNIADLTIDGEAAAETFEDGFYTIKTIYSDGSYAVGEEPYYNNDQAFLSKNRMMKRKMALTLAWPMTDALYRKNRDIFLQGLYLEAAENAADLGKLVQFRSIMATIKAMFNYYEIEEVW